MKDLWIDFGVSTVITLLRQFAAGSLPSQAYRKIFLKIFTLIWGVFSSDQDFRDVVGLSDGLPLPASQGE